MMKYFSFLIILISTLVIFSCKGEDKKTEGGSTAKMVEKTDTIVLKNQMKTIHLLPQNVNQTMMKFENMGKS